MASPERGVGGWVAADAASPWVTGLRARAPPDAGKTAPTSYRSRCPQKAAMRPSNQQAHLIAAGAGGALRVSNPTTPELCPCAYIHGKTRQIRRAGPEPRCVAKGAVLSEDLDSQGIALLPAASDASFAS